MPNVGYPSQSPNNMCFERGKVATAATATATGSTDRSTAAADRSIAADHSTAADRGRGSCRGVNKWWLLGDANDGGRPDIRCRVLGTCRGLGRLLGLISAAFCGPLGAVVVANRGLCLGHQRLYDAQLRLDPIR